MNLAELAAGLADQTLERAKDSLQEDWDAIPREDKEEVRAVLQDWATLTMQGIAGRKVDAELAHAAAAMASWQFVGASKLRKAIKAAVKDAAVFAGKLLLKLVV